MRFELSRIYGRLLELPAGKVGVKFSEAIREGQAISDAQYRSERAEADVLRQTFFQAFDKDTLFLWPAAPGAAPEGIEWTGDPRYIAPWTALGGPIVTMPAGKSANGLPLGCLLAGRPGRDTSLSRIAREVG
jgi:aspartyl-tRNA(Asn)/glutamyl-tRNA(Gln) amidotransferase subunit A